MKPWMPWLLPVALFALLLHAMADWMRSSPAREQMLRVPRPSYEALETAGPVDLAGTFVAFAGQPGGPDGRWPRFRGERFDNIVDDPTPLADTWPEGGPPVRWSLELGEGHAGPAVLGGRVYLLDYDETAHADSLRCFSLADGTELWRRAYRVHIKQNHGISRTVPAVDEQYCVTIGPKCHVLCVDAVSGDFRWGLDLVAAYGAEVPLWYTAQCPVLDAGRVILAPGGRALMVAVDAATGEVLWETPNPDGWKMSHASIIPMDLAGRRTYVYCAIGGAVGVAADGPDAGRVLWKTEDWKHTVVAPSPVRIDDEHVFLTAGYGAGSMLLRIPRGPQGPGQPERVYALDKSVFACEQQTPIYYQGHLYAVLPNDAGGNRRQLACLRPDGTPVWTSGKEHRFGLGPFLVADSKIFVLDDEGVLTLAEAAPKGFTLLARARILDGRDAWGPMAMVGGRLLLRDATRMLCLDVRSNRP